MSWVYLLVAIGLEVAATTCMKLSEGLTKPVPSVMMFVLYIISFSSLSLALKQLEVGTAYAIWSGLGTAAIAVIGVYLFKESFSAQKVIAILLIIAGCVMLNLNSDSHQSSGPAKQSVDHLSGSGESR
ncbi:multidrug efflux SMR transporter [Brevibacillus ruminantium]|uniref:Multidrug efflux SMR transporter n=1 Tax=Brevibacillus ruminantium TaxID=2950604 RepID=A0ABY4WJY2_9BACL|nr:multidrug efflux SMR transporter [Brevibacillus ruminantium]USG64961.1 multidrug efflux SMR transporter [Brevibacillus ruminantium]